MTYNNEVFRKFIRNHQPALPVLPAVHITWGTYINNILDTNKLILNKEDLIYLFYGKPAFRLNRGSYLATRLLGDAAVCFVLNMIKLPNVHRVFALDTGASFGKRYDHYFPGGVSIDDFELDADCNSGAQLVNAFFCKNEKYVNGVVKSDIRVSGTDIISDAYKAILTAQVSNSFDERACTCELQYAAELEINKESVYSIVIPDEMYGEKHVQEKIREWKVRPIIYRFRRAKPEDRTEVIFEKLGDYYKENGFM